MMFHVWNLISLMREWQTYEQEENTAGVKIQKRIRNNTKQSGKLRAPDPPAWCPLYLWWYPGWGPGTACHSSRCPTLGQSHEIMGTNIKVLYQCCEFNTALLNFVPDPGFRPNFDPVPGLYRINSEKRFLKALEDKISFKIDLFIKPQEHNGTGWNFEQIWTL